jgi:hypothetical protein
MGSKCLTKGDRVQLRAGVLNSVKIREWEFDRQEKGRILLRYTPKNYTLEVEPDEIDWEVYKASTIRMDPAPHHRNCTAEKR